MMNLENNMMGLEEIKEYLLEELKEEKQKWVMGKENKYSYIFMICNDIGVTSFLDEHHGTK